MAAYRVGQRVRIVIAEGYPELVGRCGTLIKPPAESLITYRVRIDGAVSHSVDGAYGAWEHNIEPLIDEGREMVAWDACVWQPEHLRAPA